MVESLEMAKKDFLTLLTRVDPALANDFVDWVVEQCSGLSENNLSNHSKSSDERLSSEDCFTKEEETLRSIADELRLQLPLEGICSSEQIRCPSVEEQNGLSTMVHVDAFLYDDDKIDELCEQGMMSRNYCCNCGSHNTKPLTFISHSSSIVQLKFIFKFALPKVLSQENSSVKLSNCQFIDVGSRLGAVLYGAYYFSPIKNIVGVELNSELCEMQKLIISKRRMQDRVQVRCNDICNEAEHLRNADIVMLNNVFEFFMPAEQQRRYFVAILAVAWTFLRENITKSGCFIISVPSLEDAVAALSKDREPFIDLSCWVRSCGSLESVIDACTFTDTEAEEFEQIFIYRVL